jgi:hypothetical protein
VNRELTERAVEAGKVRHAALSPAMRRAHGIVHTPAQVARWALLQVDARLRTAFGCAHGLADPRVALLDPALGTGVWLAAALERMAATSAGAVTVNQGPQLLGFDIDQEAVSAAETLLAANAERACASLSLVHANMLKLADPWGPALHDHVRVIVGNPPWAARSQSRGLRLSDAWLAEFRGDAQGISLGERRTGVLSDDYVRFFRWALEQARTSRAGTILCLATNSSYLDGPVHRGMRAALVNAFDDIEVLDLGGNALRGNDGARDENVFGVRVGACLTLAVRRPGERAMKASISYLRLSGTSAHKLAWLADASVQVAQLFEPSAPYFRFVPSRTNPDRKVCNQPWFSLVEAFPFHREGVQTNRDAFVTDPCRARLLARVQQFAAGTLDVPAARRLSDPSSRAALRGQLETASANLTRALAYRPLDDRFCFSLAPFCHRPRPDLARAVSQSNLCLLSARKDRGQGPWNLFGVTRTSADGCYLSTRSSCRTRVFPSHDVSGAPNLDPRLRDALSARIGQTLTSESLIAYAIGVLASQSFRREHDAELHLDYPRLPWPVDAAAFAQQHAAGEAWINAWLGEADSAGTDASQPIASELTYDAARAELRWGDHRMCEIEPALWHFRVGDFAVLRQLGRAACTLHDVYAAIRRVRACVHAAAQAELAYQTTNAVGSAANSLAGMY